MTFNPVQSLILASSSTYRAHLLRRIVTKVTTHSPDIDETARENEAPAELAARLAMAKASKVAQRYDSGLVLGCDQVAHIENGLTTKLGKPLTHQRAKHQLAQCSGKTVYYTTACTLIDVASGHIYNYSDQYSLEFRTLSSEQIERYLEAERPYDCAGSIKSEGLGIALISRQIGDDPSTLIGLPLIKTVDALKVFGFHVI